MQDPEKTALECDSAALAVVVEDAALAPAAAPKPSYTDPAYAYLVAKTTEKSRRTCVEAMRRIARVLGAAEDDPNAWRTIPWTKLTNAETNLIRAALTQRYAPAGVRLTLTVLRGVLGKAFDLGLIPAEQYQRATRWPRIVGQSPPAGRMLTDDEIARLRTYCNWLIGTKQTRFHGTMVRAILAVALGAGLRREEIARLTVVGVLPGELQFVGKGRKEAKQPIVQWAEEDLRAWLALRERFGFKCPTVFLQTRDDGKAYDAALTPAGVWRMIHGLGRAAGVPHFTPHDLRRTYASRMLDSRDVNKARKMLRHTNASTTLGYDRRPDEEAKSVLSEVEKMVRR